MDWPHFEEGILDTYGIFIGLNAKLCHLIAQNDPWQDENALEYENPIKLALQHLTESCTWPFPTHTTITLSCGSHMLTI